MIISDSLTKNFTPIMKADIITRPGANPEKIQKFLEQNRNLLRNYTVVLMHFGTTWLSAKSEWELYLKLVNGIINQDQYDTQLIRLNPPHATGPPEKFRDQYQKVIEFVRSVNKDAIILVSSILPRPWDHQRRHSVRISYNKILQEFNNPSAKVYFIPSYKPFFGPSASLKTELFNPDGIHLSEKGSVVLRSFFCEKIDRAKKGRLK